LAETVLHNNYGTDTLGDLSEEL